MRSSFHSKKILDKTQVLCSSVFVPPSIFAVSSGLELSWRFWCELFQAESAHSQADECQDCSWLCRVIALLCDLTCCRSIQVWSDLKLSREKRKWDLVTSVVTPRRDYVWLSRVADSKSNQCARYSCFKFHWMSRSQKPRRLHSVNVNIHLRDF